MMDASVVHFGIATSESDRIAVHRLRYDVYCEEKQYLNPVDYPDKLEYDQWDDYSVHFVAKRGKEIVGASRLIKESPYGFPIEHHFELETPKEPGITFSEFSRLIVHPSHRRRIFQVTYGFYRLVIQYSLLHDITHIYGIIDDRLIAAYDRMGFTLRRLKEPTYCFGGVTAPYAMSIEEMLDNLKKHNVRLYEFFTRSSKLEFSSSRAGD